MCVRACVWGAFLAATAGGDLSVSVRGQSENQAATPLSLRMQNPFQPPCELSACSTASTCSFRHMQNQLFLSANPPKRFQGPKLRRCLSAHHDRN